MRVLENEHMHVPHQLHVRSKPDGHARKRSALRQVMHLLRGCTEPGSAFCAAPDGGVSPAPGLHVAHLSPGALQRPLQRFAAAGATMERCETASIILYSITLGALRSSADSGRAGNAGFAAPPMPCLQPSVCRGNRWCWGFCKPVTPSKEVQGAHASAWGHSGCRSCASGRRSRWPRRARSRPRSRPRPPHLQPRCAASCGVLMHSWLRWPARALILRVGRRRCWGWRPPLGCVLLKL